LVRAETVEWRVERGEEGERGRKRG